MASGLALGLAVAAGGLPSVGGLGHAVAAPPILVSALLAAMLALWWALRRANNPAGLRERARVLKR
jgi:hypothetical protein